MSKLFAVLFLCSVLAVHALAQLASTTSLVGTITDPAGAPMGGVTVTAVNQETQDTYTAATNAEGYYEFQFVRIGTYNITAKQSGFESLSKTGITVQTNQQVRTDFTLKVGAVTENVIVSAAAPPISTEDATISEILNTKATAELPLNGRNPLRLAITTPTVIPGLKSPSGNPGGGEGFIGAGTREIQNSVSLDGISIMNNLITTTTFRPSVDAVQEVQVQTGTYPAQYGGYMGVQINLISRSGGNQFHGSVFEFVRNNYFDARGYFERPGSPQAPFRQNQFGFALTGPVVIPKLYNGRNKTFFLANYEGLRQRQAVPSTDSVLTPLMRQGNLTEFGNLTITNPLTGAVITNGIIPTSQLSPQALRALQYMPLPNLPGIRNNYQVNVPNSNDTDQTIDRLDQNIGEKVRLFFRYAESNPSLVNGNTNPYNGYTQPVQDRNILIGYTQTLTATAVNDFRFGRQHTTIDSVNFFTRPELANAGTEIGIPGFTTDINNPGLPNISITSFMAIGGQNMASSNWYQTDTTWHGADVFNWTRGPHSISAGAEIRKLITLRTANNNPRGAFTFNGQVTGSGNGVADYLLGLPQQVTTPGQLVPGGVAVYRHGYFVQDKWQVSTKLTLTLGLRYELPTVPQSTNGNGVILDPTLTRFIPEKVPQKIPYINPVHNNWAPRVGFAYRFGGWVARGGFGIFYNPNQLNSYTLATTNPPFATIFTYNSSPTALLTLANPTPAAAQGATPKPNAFTINPDLPTASMNQWSFSVERGLWRNAGLDVQYLGSHSMHLDRSYYINTPAPGPGNIDLRRPNQNFRRIRVIQNDMIANYEGLSVILRQRYTRGLTSLISYTWSHTLDVSTDSNGGGAPMDPFNWRLDYGNSNWDLRHRFVASYIYDLPWFRTASNPVLKYALGNWQVNGITIIQGGFPFNVTIPTDIVNTGEGNQRPSVVAPIVNSCGPGQLVNCLSVSSFANPAPYTFGNLGRNVLRGPGLVNFDLSVFKNFPVGERATVQLRLETFNALNHPNFGNPNATINPASPASTAAFGSITSTSTNNRQVQLAAKFTF